MNRLTRGAVSIALGVATAFGGYALNDTARADASPVLGPGLVTINVTIHYSHFSLAALHVHQGTTVRFLIRNQDPIEHEFIVGDAQIQALHEHGTEHVHPPVPGEVTLPAGELGETFYQFNQPGLVLFACHFPGHFAYGMHGWITVDNP
jgi:uncharacterized cupredoxin-like copper-binding protein